MSEQRPGEGWWLASDGKWYPPASHAEASGPTPTSEASRDIRPGSESPENPSTVEARPEPDSTERLAVTPHTGEGSAVGYVPSNAPTSNRSRFVPGLLI